LTTYVGVVIIISTITVSILANTVPVFGIAIVRPMITTEFVDLVIVIVDQDIILTLPTVTNVDTVDLLWFGFGS